jgi:hypothetical protein
MANQNKHIESSFDNLLEGTGDLAEVNANA